MTVYVDESIFGYGRMIMCHMWADTLDELHDMADKIGMQRKWFQQPPKASWCHYDISKSMRAKAVTLGAVEVDRYEALYQQGKREGKQALIDMVEAARGRKGVGS